ncbi:MAG: tyrosine-type recombinase/integrase [Myxococcota bacterium]
MLQHSHKLFGDAVIAHWPQRMRAFERHMHTCMSPRTGQGYRPASLNRLFSTVNHFSGWLHARGVLTQPWKRGFFRRLPVGGQRQPALDEQQWQVLQHVVDSLPQERRCPRRRLGLQQAVLQLLQHTGLRASELVQLNVQQLRQGALHAIRRKGGQVTARISLPVRVLRTVVSYLASCNGTSHVKALLTCRGRRLSLSMVTRICRDLSARACRLLPAHRAFRLTPHMLRRTLLQRIYRSKGLRAAQQASGNRTLRGMLCYVYRERPHELCVETRQ